MKTLARCERCGHAYWLGNNCDNCETRGNLTYKERTLNALALQDEYERYKALLELGIPKYRIASLCCSTYERVKEVIKAGHTLPSRK